MDHPRVPPFQVLAPRGDGVRLLGTGKDISLGNGWIGVFVGVLALGVTLLFILGGFVMGLIGVFGAAFPFVHAAHNSGPTSSTDSFQFNRLDPSDREGDDEEDDGPDPAYFR